MFVCPISLVEMNGMHRFVQLALAFVQSSYDRFRFSFLKTCGCVLSDKALKEMPSAICHICSKPFSVEDVVPINPDPAELEKLQARLIGEQVNKKSKRKSEAVLDDGKGKACKIEAKDSKPVSSMNGSETYKSLFISTTGSAKTKDSNFLCRGTTSRLG